jgi:hypothetical protein
MPSRVLGASRRRAARPDFLHKTAQEESQRRSAGIRLNRLHVVIGQAEMMADLMDQHMGDDGAQRLFMIAPVIEDRPAVAALWVLRTTRYLDSRRQLT